MATEVKWSEIEAECGDYRAGFVSIFKKYEGQLTDEKDKQGRVVKVTAASFSRHMGIPRQTFDRWLKRDARPRHYGVDRPRLAREHAQRMTKSEKAELAAEILAEPEVRKAVEERQLQEHPATAKRAPHGMPKERSYGFSVEMGGPSQALQRAIDDYVEAWERFSPDATQEEVETERDLIAPKILSLRMTVEEITV